MKKKTILLGLLMAGMAVTAATGCSSSKKGESNSGANEAQEEKHYVYFYNEDGDVLFTYEYKDENDVIPSFEVPKKDGYEGTWTNYRLNGKDVHVYPIYVKKNVNYTINYLLENLNNNDYVLSDTYSSTATANSEIRPFVKPFDGFECIDGGSTIIINENNPTIDLHYNRYRYTIKYETNNGETIQDQTVKYGTKLTLPTVSKDGYTLDGWYNNNQLFDNTKAVDSNLTLSARWNPNSGIKYTIEYYFENIEDDEYTKSNIYSKELTGSTDQNVTAEDLGLEGFILDNSKSTLNGKVAYDGSLVLKVYYNRQRYTVKYEPENGNTIAQQTVKYEATVANPNVARDGYTLNRWYNQYGSSFIFGSTKITENLTLTAEWIANTDTAYRVEYYYQNTDDDDYTLNEEESYDTTGTTDDYVSISPTAPTGFDLDYSYSEYKDAGDISGDGTTVFKIYYKREIRTITFDYNDGSAALAVDVKYGALVTDPNHERTGYTLSYWQSDYYGEYDFSNPVIYDETITAQWSPNTNTKYRIEYYFENIDDDGYSLNEDYSGDFEGTTNDTVYAITNPLELDINFDYFYDNAYADGYKNSGNISPDGSLVLKVYFKRNAYSVTFETNTDTQIETIENVKHGAKISAPAEITKDGYDFNYWYYYDANDNEVIFDFDNDVVTYYINFQAKWTAREDTAYRVEYYYQNIEDDDYTLDEEQSYNATGTTDTQISVDTTAPQGFVYNYDSNYYGYIYGDGSLVLRLFFDRELYSISFDTNTDIQIESLQGVKHGAKIDEPTSLEKAGYDLDYWCYYDGSNQEVKFNFDEDVIFDNITLHAIWKERTDTAYKVEVYYQNADDNDYKFDHSFNRIGTTDKSFSDLEDVSSYNEANKYVVDNYDNEKIAGDGTTVVKVYLNRLTTTVNVTYDYHCCSINQESSSFKLRYGEEFELQVTDLGALIYNYDGIYVNDEFATPEASYIISVTEDDIANESINIEIKYDIKEELSNFEYSYNSYYNELRLDGIKEDAVFEDDIVVIPDYTTEIAAYFMNGNQKYTQIVLGSGIKEIPNYAFCNTALESIFIPKQIEYIGTQAFEYSNLSSVTFEADSKLKTIYGYAFGGTNIEEFVIPKSVTSIGSSFISNSASDGKYVDIRFEEGSMLTTLESNMFVNAKINSIVIPNTITSIEESVFSSAYIKSITFEEGSTITEIPNSCFASAHICSIVLPASIETIGTNAFYNCCPINANSQGTITLQNGIKTISKQAFYYISNVTVNLPDSIETIGEQAFKYSYYGGTLTLPSSLKTIGEQAFYSCNYSTIVINEGLEEIGDSAFSGCSNLGTVFNNSTLDIVKGETTHGYVAYYAKNVYDAEQCQNVEIIGDYIIYNESSTNNVLVGYIGNDKDIVIPDGITSIASGVFGSNTNIRSVVIPSTVTTIGSYAFADCLNLVTIEIGAGVTSIEDHAFSNCYYLIDVHNKSSIPLTKGGSSNGYAAYYAKNLDNGSINLDNFDDDDNLIIYNLNDEVYLIKYVGNVEEVIIPEGVTEICSQAFQDQTKIKSVVIPASVKKICSSAFFRCYYIENLEFAEGSQLTTIESSAFRACQDLGEVILPTHLKTIGEMAFACSSSSGIGITNLVLNDELETIGPRAFEYNFKGYELIIPDSVKSVGNNAFNGCGNISYVKVGSGVTSIGTYAFNGSQVIEIYNKSSLTIAKGDSYYTNGGLGMYAKHIYTSSTEQKYVGYDDDFIYYDDGTNYILIEYIGTDKDLVIPTGVTELYMGFAMQNKNIESIFIPNTVITIGDSVFFNTGNVTSITFEEESSLESIGTYSFWCLNKVKEIYLPSSIKTIGDHSFTGLSQLNLLVFGDDSLIEHIGDDSIDGSYNLIVVLPNNALNSTTESRFTANVSQLAVIYFYGTETDYAALGLENEVYYYSEEEPATEGNFWHFDENGKPVAWTAEE